MGEAGTRGMAAAACGAWEGAERLARERGARLEALEAEGVRLREALARAEEEAGALRAERDAAVGVQRADAACGCPEPPPGGKVFVDLEEYLQGYLTRRFGLQGHMSAWEVEQLGKDFGWVMGAQVALREGP